MTINILLGVILPFIMIIVSLYLVKVYRDDNVVKWVNIAVRAAEQIYREHGQGSEKYKYVKEWIINKFNISEEDIKNIIESAVYELNKHGGKDAQKE